MLDRAHLSPGGQSPSLRGRSRPRHPTSQALPGKGLPVDGPGFPEAEQRQSRIISVNGNETVQVHLSKPVIGTRRSTAGALSFVAGLVPLLRPFLSTLFATVSSENILYVWHYDL